MCVLVVEDELIIQMDLRDALEAVGLEVLTADNGVDAIALIKRWPDRFCALVTDYKMPGGVLGTEVISEMRQVYASAPIIIATGNANNISDGFCRAYHVTVLNKPYHTDYLANILVGMLAATSA